MHVHGCVRVCVVYIRMYVCMYVCIKYRGLSYFCVPNPKKCLQHIGNNALGKDKGSQHNAHTDIVRTEPTKRHNAFELLVIFM